jgi:hypothetical protein
MIDIQTKETDIGNKLEKIRLHRLNTMILNEIREYFEYYVKYHNRFVFRIVKQDVSEILDKQGVTYGIQYIYDKESDTVTITIGKNYTMNIKITSDPEFYI